MCVLGYQPRSKKVSSNEDIGEMIASACAKHFNVAVQQGDLVMSYPGV